MNREWEDCPACSRDRRIADAMGEPAGDCLTCETHFKEIDIEKAKTRAEVISLIKQAWEITFHPSQLGKTAGAKKRFEAAVDMVEHPHEAVGQAL